MNVWAEFQGLLRYNIYLGFSETNLCKGAEWHDKFSLKSSLDSNKGILGCRRPENTYIIARIIVFSFIVHPLDFNKRVG